MITVGTSSCSIVVLTRNIITEHNVLFERCTENIKRVLHTPMLSVGRSQSYMILFLNTISHLTQNTAVLPICSTAISEKGAKLQRDSGTNS